MIEKIVMSEEFIVLLVTIECIDGWNINVFIQSVFKDAFFSVAFTGFVNGLALANLINIRHKFESPHFLRYVRSSFGLSQFTAIEKKFIFLKFFEKIRRSANIHLVIENLIFGKFWHKMP